MLKKAIAVLLLLPTLSMAAVQIVVLSVNDAGSNRLTYNYLCWLNSPNALPNPNFVSQWKALGASAGPSTAQVTALQNGSVVEETGSLTVSSTTVISAVETTLIADCTSRQSYLTGIPGPGVFYGQTWTGTAWVQQ